MDVWGEQIQRPLKSAGGGCFPFLCNVPADGRREDIHQEQNFQCGDIRSSGISRLRHHPF